MTEAIDIAISWEAFEDAPERPRKPKESLQVAPVAASKPADKPDIASALENISKLVEDMGARMQTLESRGHRPGYNGGRPRPSYSAPRDYSKARCYECHELGHIRRLCPKLVQNPVACVSPGVSAPSFASESTN